MLLAPAALIVALSAAAPGGSGGACTGCATGCWEACPKTCRNEVEGGFIDGRECRPAGWSCWDEPVRSCAGLAWAPVRIGIAAVVLPLFLTEPKCGGRLPGLDDVALFFVFGVSMKQCSPPAPEEPPLDDDNTGMHY